MQDRHHVLFNRQEWGLREQSLYLRNQPLLIPTIDRDAHTELHRDCPAVPPLGYHALKRVVKLWEPGNTPLRAMANLSHAIEASTRNPFAHRIEKELAHLAAEAIDLQRPYIMDGMSSEKTFIDLGGAA